MPAFRRDCVHRAVRLAVLKLITAATTPSFEPGATAPAIRFSIARSMPAYQGIRRTTTGASGYGSLYTSTRPTPVPPPTPETTAVYAPGWSVMWMADARGLVGANPLEKIGAALAALPQSSFAAMRA